MSCRPHMMAWAAACLTAVHVAGGMPVVRDLAAMPAGAEWAGPRPRRSRCRLLQHVVRAMVDPDTEHLEKQLFQTLNTVDAALKAGGTDCEGHMFHTGAEVASGNYGAVFFDRRNGARAVKFMFQGKEGGNQIIENFDRGCEVMQRLQARARVPQCFAVCDVVHAGKNTKALLMGYIPDAADMRSVKGEATNAKSTYMWERIGYQLYTSVMGMISSDTCQFRSELDQYPRRQALERGLHRHGQSGRARHVGRLLPPGAGRGAGQHTFDVLRELGLSGGDDCERGLRRDAHCRGLPISQPTWLDPVPHSGNRDGGGRD